MRILWHGVHPMVPSGYGVQTALFCKALAGLGHEVYISCAYGQQGFVSTWEDIPVLPHDNMMGNYGNNSVLLHARELKPDVVFTLQDVFVYQPDIWRQLPWAAIVPVDSDPLMLRNKPMLDVCKWHVAMSRFGEKVLKEAGYKDVLYLPHMVDEKVFYPMPMSTARSMLSTAWNRDLSDAYIICVNSANAGIQGRKNFAETFAAFKLFDHKKALLYLHCEPLGLRDGGDNLDAMLDMFGVDKTRVIVPPQWRYFCGALSQDYLRVIYSASNVYLNASKGEGFGIPTIEAQMCGCPALVTNFSASPELVFTGTTMDGILHYVPFRTRQMLVPAETIARALMSTLKWHRNNDDAKATATRTAAHYGITAGTQRLVEVLGKIAADVAASKGGLMAP